MDIFICFAMIILTGLVSFTASGDLWRLDNGYFEFTVEVGLPTEGLLPVGKLVNLRVDPKGEGKYQTLGKALWIEGAGVTTKTKTERKGEKVSITGLQYCTQSLIEVSEADTADLLIAERPLGQSFKVEDGHFCKVGGRFPTWYTTTSGMTLRLRKEGPEGEVIVSKAFENVPDNSWQYLEFAPQPPGIYYLEISNPVGTIGWWTKSANCYTGGQAYEGGQPVAGRDRTLKVYAHAKADFSVELMQKKLKVQVTIDTFSQRAAPSPSFLLSTPWKKSGYEVNKESGVLFKRFFSSQGQYYPIEQLKRRDFSDPNFSTGDWLEGTGTGNYDLRFVAKGLTLSWTMEEDTMHFHFGVTPKAIGPGKAFSELTIEIKPHKDWLPDFFPAFFSSNPTLDKVTNSFFYERAFSYPPEAYPIAPWFEWTAIIRSWLLPPLREGEVKSLRTALMTAKIDEKGYVYTWGNLKGWPFPNPEEYDTRHFDTNARFILACWRYYCWTKDKEFLNSQIGRLRKAMNYQLKDLQGEEGIIITNSKDVNGKDGGCSSNYWDILPFGHKDAYCNIYYYASLEAMAQIEAVMGKSGEERRLYRPPEFYRHLKGEVKKTYNELFWDDSKGRYIGCIDLDGVKHDYGFVFLNLEALFYGLGDKEKAKRIYHWLEYEPTSSGICDTYTKWVFAPRATTIHNPARNEPQEPYPSWWHFGWGGTPFGDQCQDGGAILYTSFYDIMSRLRYLGADNAWGRLNAILKRYQEPDKLCGGPPLFHGEIPQQENPGQVGVDLPFPESGLVPTSFLYGFLGISADIKGLKIQPNLPKDLRFAGIKNLCYRHLPLNITVSRDWVQIACYKPGYQFVLKKTLKPGEPFVFKAPPTRIKGFPKPPQPVTPWDRRTQWIWHPSALDTENFTCYFRKSFSLPKKPDRATLFITADNQYEVWVNDKRVGAGFDWRRAQNYEITKLLKKGKNLIAVLATNWSGPAGLLVQINITVSGKRLRICSESAWRVTDKEEKGWRQLQLQEKDWKNAQPLGSPPVGPWGEIMVN